MHFHLKKAIVISICTSVRVVILEQDCRYRFFKIFRLGKSQLCGRPVNCWQLLLFLCGSTNCLLVDAVVVSWLALMLLYLAHNSVFLDPSSSKQNVESNYRGGKKANNSFYTCSGCRLCFEHQIRIYSRVWFCVRMPILRFFLLIFFIV